MAKRIITPFAEQGDKDIIPESPVGLDVNWQTGYPQSYEEDPGTPENPNLDARFVERDKTNQLLNDITSNTKEWQERAYPEFILPSNNGGIPFPYGKGAVVSYNGLYYISLNGSNTAIPTSSSWDVYIPEDTQRILKLKIFQSPTDNLTKIEAFAGSSGVVYEVRKTSDNSLATIYSDKDGVTSIPQNGTDNISNGDAEVVFYIERNNYIITIGGISQTFTTVKDESNIAYVTDLIFGAVPQSSYTTSIADSAGAFTSARGYVGSEGTVYFPAIKGEPETHYWISTTNLSNCYIGADKGVVIHVDAISDAQGNEVKLVTPVTFSEETPNTTKDFGYKMTSNDEVNEYLSVAAAISTALEKSKTLTRNSDLLLDFDPVQISAFNPLALTETSTGMDRIRPQVSWSDPASAGVDWQGVYKKGVSIGEQYEFLLDITSVGSSGKFRLVVSTSNIASHWEFSVGSGVIRWYQTGTSISKEIPTNNATNGLLPDDGCVRVAIKRLSTTKIQLLVNDTIFDTQEISAGVRFIAVVADQNARTIGKIKYANMIKNSVVAGGRPLNIVCVGDSITKGSRNSTPWPLLIEKLAQHMPGVGKLTVVNEAVSGTSTDGWTGGATPIMNTIDFSQYDYALVMLGVNDNQGGGASRINTFATNIGLLSDKIVADGCTPIWSTMPKYTKASSTGNGNEALNSSIFARFNSVLKDFCLSNGYTIAEACDFFGENYGYAGSFSGLISPSWYTDNIHPQTQGHIAIASAFSAALTKAENAEPKYTSESERLKPVNSWVVNSEDTYGYPRAMLKDGIVYLSGSVSGGSPSTVLANLPVQFRPSSIKNVIVRSNSGTVNGIAELTIQVNGDITAGPNTFTNFIDLNCSFSLF